MSSTRSASIAFSLVIVHFSKLVFRHAIEAINEPSLDHGRTNQPSSDHWSYRSAIIRPWRDRSAIIRPWRDQSYTQRVSEISLPHRFLPQDDRKYVERSHQENPHFCLEEALVGERCRMCF
ncbi:hypothetical protein AVEN_44309-1 [Araneus ventricosus]|uniref:Uncharacterized protein n=1 Tax=Araneus ventricosus TaxID=182803 RepID=A0A4Y2DPP2_ARAVE|nr:hypothetical protein AVEN_44309-1 [Araneus ventricosus]